jgi:hypothetical protein
MGRISAHGREASQFSCVVGGWQGTEVIQQGIQSGLLFSCGRNTTNGTYASARFNKFFRSGVLILQHTRPSRLPRAWEPYHQLRG